MYTMPLILLVIFVIVLFVNIYLYLKDYTYKIKNDINLKYYMALNFSTVLLNLVLLGLIGYYLFSIYNQLNS